MISQIPTISGIVVIKALEKIGYKVSRVRGSHHRLVHAERRAVTVPVHRGRDVPKGTLRGILREAGLTVEEFLTLL